MLPIQKLNAFYTTISKSLGKVKSQPKTKYLSPLKNVNKDLKNVNKDTLGLILNQKERNSLEKHGRNSGHRKQGLKEKVQRKKKDKNNDEDNHGGGMLQPLIQDLKGLIQRKRNPSPIQ